MQKRKWLRRGILAECLLLVLTGVFYFRQEFRVTQTTAEPDEKKEYIRWVEFHPTEELMTQAYRLDVETYDEPVHLCWIDLLAWLAAKHGGEFPSGCAKELDKFAEELINGETTIEKATADMKYYSYYKSIFFSFYYFFVVFLRLFCHVLTPFYCH